MCNRKKRVIIWADCKDFLSENDKLVGGLNIQMNFWARTFFKHDWDTFCLTYIKDKVDFINDGIKEIYYPLFRHGVTVMSLMISFFILIKYRPSVVISRGRLISAFYLSLFSKIFGYKYILMLASDSSVDKYNEAKDDSKTRLFRIGVKRTRYIVAQNSLQKILLHKHYGKDSLIVPNIWLNSYPLARYDTLRKDILWVSNIRAIKQPDLFISIAAVLKPYKFIMVGGAYDSTLYKKCKVDADNIPNVKFIGRMNFKETNELFSKARLFICTSKKEGFPNTFLQAWSNNIPIISTVDPSDVIMTNQLGIVATNLDELIEAVDLLMTNEKLYLKMSTNIERYFESMHDPDIYYERMCLEFGL